MPRKGKTEGIHEIPIETDEPQAPAKAEAAGAGRGDTPPAPKPETDRMSDMGGSGAEGKPAPESADTTYEDAVDHLKRLQAEFTNYRRRVERERGEVTGWAQRSLVEKLLPVVDDFERAAASVEGEQSPAADGLALIRDKLARVLAEAGLERIETDGAVFDPEVHEALMTLPVEPDKVGKVVSELVPGYTFKGQLVRPSRVQVGIEAEEE
jgi:molecular chaperone GrpE